MNAWCGKHIAVIGLGVTNIPLIRYLKGKGAFVEGRDKQSARSLGDRFETLQALKIPCVLGPDYLENLDSFDGVFLSPGVPKKKPELLRLQVPLYSEIELVLWESKAPVLGITGSSGKTTTTTLVGEMLRESGFLTFVGGNIGTPLIEEIEAVTKDSRVVLELSSFQLEKLKRSPTAALITNISENHLDVHGTMEEYIQAKEQIYRYQDPEDILVLNYDDPITRAMEQKCVAQVFFFSRKEEVPKGAFVSPEGFLVYQDKTQRVVFAHKEEVLLKGAHNLENLLAAITLSYLFQADPRAISHVVRTFQGVSHRLEKVRTYEGVDYYNDSIATTPARTIAGLRSYEEKVILIAGGYDKKLSFDELASVIKERVKLLILLGETKEAILESVEKVSSLPVFCVEDLQEAVVLARKWAKSKDVVLLSPACASFGLYTDYKERGSHFRALVERLHES